MPKDGSEKFDTPSPRSIGIMAFGGNQKQNLGLQSLRGKILSRKELLSYDFP